MILLVKFHALMLKFAIGKLTRINNSFKDGHLKSSAFVKSIQVFFNFNILGNLKNFDKNQRNFAKFPFKKSPHHNQNDQRIKRHHLVRENGDWPHTTVHLPCLKHPSAALLIEQRPKEHRRNEHHKNGANILHTRHQLLVVFWHRVVEPMLRFVPFESKEIK